MNYKKHLLLMLGFLLSISNLTAQQITNSITVTFSAQPLSEAIKKIEDICEYRFFYDAGKIDMKQKVSLNAQNESINSAISAMLEPTNVSFQITQKQIALFPREVKTRVKEKQKSSMVKLQTSKEIR